MDFPYQVLLCASEPVENQSLAAREVVIYKCRWQRESERTHGFKLCKHFARAACFVGGMSKNPGSTLNSIWDVKLLQEKLWK